MPPDPPRKACPMTAAPPPPTFTFKIFLPELDRALLEVLSRRTNGFVSCALLNDSHEPCSAALCPNATDIDNGMVTLTGNFINDTAIYTCDSGFELIGSANLTCTLVDANSSAFQPAPPFCRREYTELNDFGCMCRS